MEFVHTSVLLQEVMEQLSIRPSGIYVDGTLGRAGHSFEICSRLEDQGRLIGFDQDGDAIKAATEHLKPFAGRVEIIRSNFSGMKQELADRDIHQVDGILLDLGVSSYQLDNQDRGFTYRYDVPLDMRMDDRQELSATTVVNEYSQKELFHIIRDYGEDRFAQNIARHIVEERQREPIRTTGRLAEIIDRSIPMKFKKQGGHPAKRTFQAIRIEVNQELRVLEEHIQEMIDLLTPGGRICIITFHSLEDRIVKNAFRTAQNPCICPPEFPVCVCGRRSKGKVLTRKPILPTEREMEENPRSKSAKLRVFEHI